MADQTERAVLAAEPALPVGETRLSAGAVLRVLPPRALVRLQIPRRMIPQAGALRVGSTALPTTPGRCVGVDPAVLWLAPDGWLLISDVQDGATLVSGVRRDCGDLGVAAVDVGGDVVVGHDAVAVEKQEIPTGGEPCRRVANSCKAEAFVRLGRESHGKRGRGRE